jgi:hypothetical protein
MPETISTSRRLSTAAYILRAFCVLVFVAIAVAAFVGRQSGRAGGEDVSLTVILFLLAAYIVLVTYKKYFGGMRSFFGCGLVLFSVHVVGNVFLWSATPRTTVLADMIFAAVAFVFGCLLLLGGYERHCRLRAPA